MVCICLFVFGGTRIIARILKAFLWLALCKGGVFPCVRNTSDNVATAVYAVTDGNDDVKVTVSVGGSIFSMLAIYNDAVLLETHVLCMIRSLKYQYLFRVNSPLC